MKKYVGTKTIEAEPMNYLDFLKDQDRTPKLDTEDKEGYKVVYPDGYVSWSPKDVFEEAYDELIVGPEANSETLIQESVFPSDILSVGVVLDLEYGGAHQYQFQNSLGFNNGEAKYDYSYQKIQFVQKNSDGTMKPGLQNEQLVIALIDRTKKLNAKYPSEFNEQMLRGLNMFIDACEARIQDRIDRGVMGELKK